MEKDQKINTENKDTEIDKIAPEEQDKEIGRA